MPFDTPSFFEISKIIFVSWIKNQLLDMNHCMMNGLQWMIMDTFLQ